MNTLLISVPFILIIGALLISRSKARLFTDPEQEDEERAARAAAYDVARTEWTKGRAKMNDTYYHDSYGSIGRYSFWRDLAQIDGRRSVYMPQPDYSMYWPAQPDSIIQPYQPLI